MTAACPRAVEAAPPILVAAPGEHALPAWAVDILDAAGAEVARLLGELAPSIDAAVLVMEREASIVIETRPRLDVARLCSRVGLERVARRLATRAPGSRRWLVVQAHDGETVSLAVRPLGHVSSGGRA
jgi:hypothetical protein